MTKARNMQRADKIVLNLNAEVLSVEPLPNGLVKVRVAATGSPSLDYADGSGIVEIICKSGRVFSSRPPRPDGPWPPRFDGDDDDDGDPPIDPTPANLIDVRKRKRINA